MARSDEEFTSALRQVLDGSTDNIDDETVVRLVAARREALGQRTARRAHVPHFAPAIAFAASVAVLAVMLRLPDGEIPLLEADPTLIDVALADSDLELIEQLEFFRWLDASGHAG